jgi:hypothetical protein
LIGTPAGFISDRWPTSPRIGGRLQIGIPGRLRSESADKIEVGEDGLVDSHAYAHYLHHKYFEVNYGDALIPLDQWFGTWHDGSADREARIQARHKERKTRIAAKLAQKAAAAKAPAP